MCEKCERPAKTVIRDNTVSYRTVTEYNNRGELLSRDNQMAYNYDNTHITHPTSRNPFKSKRPITNASNIAFTTGTHNDYAPAKHSLFGRKKVVVQTAAPRQITAADSAMAVVGGMFAIAGTIAAHASNPPQQQYVQPQQQKKSSRSERKQQQRMIENQPPSCSCTMWTTEGCALHDWRYRRD